MERVRAGEDFDAARFRAFRRAVLGTLTRRGRELLPLAEVLSAAGDENRWDAGRLEIPLDRVVGSAAQSKAVDFDRSFLPSGRRIRDRWTRIYRAMVEGDELPPIDVYQVGADYFVADGHHRVSVARSLGRPTIAARVTRIETRAPLGTSLETAALLRAAEYTAFLSETDLHRSRPGARLECSRLGRYDEMLAHIDGHGYFLGLERGQPVSRTEAAVSWFDHVFTPIARLIERHSVLQELPGSTEADVYVEVTRLWLALAMEGAPSGPEAAVDALRNAANLIRRRPRLRLPFS